MNKTLKLLATAGACAVVSLATFTASEALAGSDPAAAPVVRELPWDGSESLTLEIPANVRFIQTDGPGKVVVTGARRSVEQFSASGGVLGDSRWRTGKPLDIVVNAPRITRFSLKGSDRLVVEAFDQPQLFIETTGRSEVKVTGKADHLTLNLQGFGWVDLSALTAAEADVTLTGARHALVAVRDRARITGSGSVVLIGKPAELQLALGESLELRPEVGHVLVGVLGGQSRMGAADLFRRRLGQHAQDLGPGGRGRGRRRRDPAFVPGEFRGGLLAAAVPLSALLLAQCTRLALGCAPWRTTRLGSMCLQ